MAREKPTPVPLHTLAPGQPPADFFALLSQRTARTTRDGKAFYTCQFRDAKRKLDAAPIWADGDLFAACDRDWRPGMAFKVRGTLHEHERYGLQLEIHQIRPATPADAIDGFDETLLYDRSRFDPAESFAALRNLAEAQIQDVPLRTLVVSLLDAHADTLLLLPASVDRFFPFPGGWLEHTLSVTFSCAWLADKYIAHYPDLTPPLNRDLVVAGAVLHDIGRVAELAVGPPGEPPTRTVAGELFGHVALGRDLIRAAAANVPDLNPDLLRLLEHVVYAHLTRPEWGSPRLPAIPEVLILHHADDLDAKLEMFARCLTTDTGDGPFTAPDPVLKRPLLKKREA